MANRFAVKFFSSKNVDHNCFQIQGFTIWYLVGRNVGNSFASYTKLHAKYVTLQKEGTSFPKVLLFGFYRQRGRRLFYDTRKMHSKMSVGPRITKSNDPYVAKPSNNIKKRIAFQVELN